MTGVLILMASAAFTALSGWIYWQMQQAEKRLQVQESEIRQKAVLIGELADELSLASKYLYEAMDKCVTRIDGVEGRRSGIESRADDGASLVAEQIFTATKVTPPVEAVERNAPASASATEQSVRRLVENAAERPAVGMPTVGEWPAPESVSIGSDSRPGNGSASPLPVQTPALHRPIEAELTKQMQPNVSGEEQEVGQGEQQEAAEYHPHFLALELNARGADLLQIARQTGLGLEELRLLLRFQEEVGLTA